MCALPMWGGGAGGSKDSVIKNPNMRVLHFVFITLMYLVLISRSNLLISPEVISPLGKKKKAIIILKEEMNFFGHVFN